MAKQLIRVKASSKKYKKYERILNRYFKDHDAEFQKVLLSAWTDLVLYGTTVIEPPKEWYGKGVADCIQGIDFDKSYGGTD